MDTKKKQFYYNILVVAAIILAVLTFTPLVIPYGKYEPTLFHLPYTLWTGLLVAILFVTMTWIASKIHPYNEEKDQL